MILSAHQPAYLPWLGYFDKLARSDVFVYLDTVQYEKNSFTNRNRIKTPQGNQWLTVPVKTKGHTSSTLTETEIDNSQDWRGKHLRAIQLNYRKALRFAQCYPKLEALYMEEFLLLSELCYRHLGFWLGELGIERRIVRSSTLSITSRKSDLVFDLCRHFGANHYLSGALGRDYLDEPKFAAAGIHVEYQAYSHPVYPQLYGGFSPYMGVIDYWMNVDDSSLISAGLNSGPINGGSKSE